MKARPSVLLLASLSFLFCSAAAAQSNPNLEVGLKPFGAYDETSFDAVSLANGNLTLHLPLFDYPQRGGMREQVALLYNSKGWQVKFDCTQLSCVAYWRWADGYASGPTVYLDTNRLGVTVSVWKGPGGTWIYDFSGITSDGSHHQMAQTVAGGYRSIDASGMYFNDPNGINAFYAGDYVMYDRQGGWHDSSRYWSDTNGNYFSISSNPSVWTDTLGRSFSSAANDDTTGCASGSGLLTVSYAQTLSYPALNGETRSVKVCYASLPMKTHFAAKVNDPVTDLLINVSEANTGTFVIQSVIVNDGTGWSTSPQWSFQYNDTDGRTDGTNYGDITQVTLPTGGTITYTWTTKTFCPGAATHMSRVVASRTTNANDGKGNQTTTYSNGTVTDPAGNDVVHHITGLGGSCSYYDTEVDYYKGNHLAPSPVLLKIVQTAYSWTSNPLDPYGDVTSTAANVVPISVTTKYPIPNSGNYLASQVQTDYDNSFTFYPNAVTGGTYGRINEKREYGFGLNSPGALLRKTSYVYEALAGNAYLTANLLDLVATETVYDGSGSRKAQTINAYDGTTLQSSGVTMQHATLPNPGTRGNRTQQQQWLSGAGTMVTTQQTKFYDTGMPYQSTDLRNNVTTYSYNPAYYGVYLTQTQYPNTGSPPVSHSISGIYDLNTGLLTSFTDQNGQVSSYLYDVLDRVQSGSYPDGGSVGFTYTDTVPWQIQKTVAVTGTLNKVTNSVFDGLGRLSQTQFHDPDCTVGSQLVKVDYAYGNDTGQNTHYTTTTTPYCDTPGSVFGLPTRSDSDTLGRVTKVTQTDGSVAITSYAANSTVYTTTVTDEAGNARQSQSDALGRMTAVFEDPGTSPHFNYETDYGYDILNNLISVNQKGDNSAPRTRSFVYDPLSRLISASNPESGTTSYTYSNDSNGCAGAPRIGCTKTAPTPDQLGTATVTTTYTYDALNRLTRKSYAGMSTPSIFYGYDKDSSTLSSCITTPPTLTDSYPVGTRTGMCDSSGATSWAHDKMGRVLTETRNIGTRINSVGYQFYLDGSTSQVTYPNTGRVLTYTINSSGNYTAGRSVSVSDGITSYVNAAKYAPQGGLFTFNNGASISQAITYNGRLQPLQLYATAGTIGSQTLTQLQQGTACPGVTASIMGRSYNFNAGTADNGNVISITNCIDSNRSANYFYDRLNRISYAYSSGSNWGETYTIDPWGNLTNIAPYSNKTWHENLNASPASTKNQLNGFCNDAAGNLVLNSTCPQGQLFPIYFHDAENRLVSAGGWTYVYDGDGNRVEKCNVSPPASCPTSGTGTLYWRGVSGDPLSEINLAGTSQEEYVFFGGSRVARRDMSGGNVHYYFADHLGSASAVTNSVGSTTPYPEEDLDYYPYGGIVATSTDTVPQNYKFTGKERDAESGLDYFGARFNASAMGRFMSPDPSARGAELRDPQTWNCYAYVTNNPLKFNDPTGEARNPITNQEGLNPSPSSERGRINGTLHNPHKGEYGMVRTVSTANDKPHRGVDVLAPSGTPVHAPQDGTVVRITGNASDKCSTCFGLTIYVKTETGETVQFSHLSATAASLKPGSAVEAGQIIAASGTSGNAHDVSKEEQHLHVQVTDQSGHEINPVDYFNDPNTKPDFLDQNVNPPANTCTPDRCEHSSPPHAAPPSGK